MINKSLFAFSLLAMAAGTAHADESFLPQADIAIRVISAHPVVAAAEAQLAEAAAEARVRKAGGHEFQLSGSYIRRDVRGEGTYSEWDSSISRAIRLPGKAKADRRIGSLGVEVAENARDDARHQVALLLKDYWFEWLEAAARTEIDDQTVASYTRELEMVKRRYELKEAAFLDVDSARSALALAQATATRNKARVLEAERAIRTMFPDLALPLQVPELESPTDTEYSFDVWKEMILTRSHELRMAEKEAEQQMALAKRTKLDKIADPTVGLRFFSERGGEEKGVGVLFSMPFGRTHRSAKSDAQRAKALAAEANVRQVRRLIEEVADRDITRAEAGLQVWEQTLEALKASEQVAARVRRAVEVGEQDTVELMRALAQLYEVQREELSARITAQDAITQLRIDSHEIWVASHHDHDD